MVIVESFTTFLYRNFINYVCIYLWCGWQLGCVVASLY